MSVRKIDEVYKAECFTPGEFAVLMCLAYAHNEKTGRCFPSYQTISKKVGMTRRGVINIIKALEDRDHITVKHRRRRPSKGPAPGPDASNEYQIHIAPPEDANMSLSSPLGVNSVHPIGKYDKEVLKAKIEKEVDLDGTSQAICNSTKHFSFKTQEGSGDSIGKVGVSVGEKLAPIGQSTTIQVPPKVTGVPSADFVEKYKDLPDHEFINRVWVSFNKPLMSFDASLTMWFVVLGRFFPDKIPSGYKPLLGKYEKNALLELRHLLAQLDSTELDSQPSPFLAIVLHAVWHWQEVSGYAKQKGMWKIPKNGPTLCFIRNNLECAFATLKTPFPEKYFQLAEEEKTKKILWDALRDFLIMCGADSFDVDMRIKNSKIMNNPKSTLLWFEERIQAGIKAGVPVPNSLAPYIQQAIGG